jgi:hypothetical protein
MFYGIQWQDKCDGRSGKKWTCSALKHWQKYGEKSRKVSVNMTRLLAGIRNLDSPNTMQE